MMKALNDIRLPRTAKRDNFFAMQSEEVMNQRLKQNFRMLQQAVNTLESWKDTAEETIIAKFPAMADRIVTHDTDGLWEWYVSDDGIITAWILTVAAVVNCTTAIGNMYYGTATVTLPTDLYDTIITVLATVFSSANVVFLGGKTATKTTLTVNVVSPTSASVTVQFGVQVYGR